MFNMTISWINLSMSILGSRSMSQWLEKNIVMALARSFIDFDLTSHNYVVQV